jgi:flavin-dependent dehydrogenase
MIKIAGLGISGMFLYWRLKNDGFDVEAYDPKKKDFYIPCGYATNERLMKSYMSKINVDFDRYILTRADKIIFSGNNFSGKTMESSGLCTFDKNRLENDVSKEILSKPIKVEKDDIIIDATGISRSYLGSTHSDTQYSTLEYLTDYSDFKDFYFYFLPKGRGYFWSFPLGNMYHIGVGSLSREDFKMVRKYRKAIVTSRNIRMSPQFASVKKGNVIGVGEAIGTVSPVTGEGIVPSLKSAELLYNCMENGNTEEIGNVYQKKVIREFGYYYKLSNMVSNIQRGKILSFDNISGIKDVKRTVNEFGVKFEILPFLKHFLG